MRRFAAAVVFLGAVWVPSSSLEGVPPARRDEGRLAEMYQVWSAALDRPTLAHVGGERPGPDEVFLVKNTASAGSGNADSLRAGLRKALDFPPEHDADLEEILEDAVRCRGRRVVLDPARVHTTTRLVLLSPEDHLEATSLMLRQVVNVLDPENRRHAAAAAYSITIGYVSFNRDRTVAVLDQSVECGDLCGQRFTRVMVRTASGLWIDRPRWMGAHEIS